MTCTCEISPAEMEVMRILWAEAPLTGRDIIDRLLNISDWKEGTIKSLINRLINKGAIRKDETSKPFALYPTLTSETVTYQRIDEEIKFICSKDRGDLIRHLIEANTLSKTQLSELLQVIGLKMTDAPSEVPCDCLPGQCHCQHATH